MIKTNITYGLIILIPVAIIVLLLAKIVEILETVGVVHLVNPELVARLDASVADVTGCVSQWGIGSTKVLAQAASGKQADH